MTDQEPPHNCADIALLVHQKCGAKFAALPAAHQTMFAEIVRTRKRRGDQVAWMRNMWLHLMHDGPLPSTFDTDTPLLFTAPTAPPKATRQMLAEVLFDARLMAGVRNWPIALRSYVAGSFRDGQQIRPSPASSLKCELA